MYNVIKRYVENEYSNGLLLVDMPTGSGKTYSAIEYIYDSCMNPDNKNRKYIFVTTLKKNLPYEDLKKRFEKAGNITLYDEKVLVINSNIDSVIDGWSKEVEQAIPAEIKKTEEYRKFHCDLVFVQKKQNDKTPMMKDLISSIKANLREKTEPKFRHLVSDYLCKEYATVEQRIYAIKTEKKWQWLGKIYPAVFTKDRQVIFMSMDKLMSRNSTIVEPSYMFYNSDVIKNAVLFIDEFDATKDTILKKIIENGLRDKVNFIELFKDIYSALHTDDFPAVLTIPSQMRASGEFRKQSLESIVDGLRERADYIYNTYSLQYKHRTQDELADTYQNYLFQDHQFHTILNDNNSYITMQSDEKKKINSIGFSQNKPPKGSSNIHTMLGQLRGFVTYFQVTVSILSYNYMQRKNERRKEGEDVFTLEAAIKSVLSLFRLSKENIDYLTNQILMSSHKVKGEIEPSDFDLSFYENGFRYYAFENNTEHDMQSQIMMYSFQNTPEKILLRYCEKAKVIGISATATVPSVVGNYDIKYLKNKMQKVYVEITEEEKRRLKESFNLQQEGYKNINIQTELLGDGEDYTDKSWLKVFENAELAQKIYSQIERAFGESEGDYQKRRYLRIALAFKQFVVHEDIYSFLCVLNKHPKVGDRDLDKNVLQDIFKYIAYEKGWSSYSIKNNVVFLTGDDYEDNKTGLIDRLSRGAKLFVISVYQTIGAGQNLQYPVPDVLANRIVKTNDRNLRNEKDFDAIYLDKPTNLITYLGDNLEEKEFIKYLFQMEFLQDAAEVSINATMCNIKKAFRTYIMGHRTEDRSENIYNKKSVMMLSTRYIIQAIGRICRTNQKNKNIYIYADDSIAENIDTSVVNGRNFNPEFIALVDKIKEIGVKSPEVMSLEYKASLNSVRVNKEIRNMLNNDWSEAKIKKWKALRQLSLICPTASSELASKNFIIQNFFVELPNKSNHYFYYQQEDYNNVSVSFNSDREHTLRVSEDGTQLRDMLRIPGVRELFETNGYATSFENNEFIMSPPLWNNIYKGALGEVVGKFLIEKNLDVTVKEIDDINLFELFDYRIEGCSIFVDFKNWNEGHTEDKTAMINKIAGKAKKCGCKCVVIANIYGKRKWRISDVTVDGVRIITLPYLVKDTDGQLSFDKEAWDLFRRCVDEYKC